jgi:hypothetical protein
MFDIDNWWLRLLNCSIGGGWKRTFDLIQVELDGISGNCMGNPRNKAKRFRAVFGGQRNFVRTGKCLELDQTKWYCAGSNQMSGSNRLFQPVTYRLLQRPSL